MTAQFRQKTKPKIVIQWQADKSLDRYFNEYGIETYVVKSLGLENNGVSYEYASGSIWDWEIGVYSSKSYTFEIYGNGEVYTLINSRWNNTDNEFDHGTFIIRDKYVHIYTSAIVEGLGTRYDYIEAMPGEKYFLTINLRME